VKADLPRLTYEDLFRTQASLLRLTRTDGAEDPLFERQVLQTSIEREQTTTRSMVDGALLVATADQGQPPERSTFDDQERLLSTADAHGNVTRFEYDALGRPVAVTLPSGARQTQQFDAYGRLRRVVRAGLGETVHRYDAVTGMLVGREHFTPHGRLERSVRITRDALGRPLTEIHTLAATGTSAEETRTFQYDYDGVVPGEETRPGQKGFLSRVRGEGFEKRSVYGRDGRLTDAITSLTDWRTVRQHFEYHDDGAIRAETWILLNSAGKELSRLQKDDSYDRTGRLARVRLNGADLALFSYDDDDRLTTAALAGGESLTYSFDSTTGQTSGYRYGRDGHLRTLNWAWNARGLLDSETVSVNGAVRTLVYGYDARRFLTSSVDGSPGVSALTTLGARRLTANAAPPSAQYTYDVDGLLTAVTDAEGSRSVSTQRSTLVSGDVTYVYDDAGRVVRKGTLALRYGPDGHLAHAERDEERWDFLSDEDGQRLLKRKGGVPVAGYVSGAYVTDTSLFVPYGIHGHVVGVVENGVFRPALTDERGTVLEDAAGLNVPTPYGLRRTRPALSAALDYAERGYDADLGTVRMGVRDYDPYLGRFHTPDPLMVGSLEACSDSPLECNLYSYALNNPLLNLDRDGQESTAARVVTRLLEGAVDHVTTVGQGLGRMAMTPVRFGRAVLGGRWDEAKQEAKFYGTRLLMSTAVGVSYGTIKAAVGTAQEVGATVSAGDGDQMLRMAGRAGANLLLSRAIGHSGRALSAARASVAKAKAVAATPVGKRPTTHLRKGTVQDVWDKATPGSTPGSKACSTCGKDVQVAPGSGTKRDWDADHFPKWKDRDLSGKTWPDVLNEYNKDLRLRCITCNRADNR
jgi:RHS repeat-associated protein